MACKRQFNILGKISFRLILGQNNFHFNIIHINQLKISYYAVAFIISKASFAYSDLTNIFTSANPSSVNPYTNRSVSPLSKVFIPLLSSKERIT